jgi:hypothetical protein
VLAHRLAERIAVVLRRKRSSHPAWQQCRLFSEHPRRLRRPGLLEPDAVVTVLSESPQHAVSYGSWRNAA